MHRDNPAATCTFPLAAKFSSDAALQRTSVTARSQALLAKYQFPLDKKIFLDLSQMKPKISSAAPVRNDTAL